MYKSIILLLRTRKFENYYSTVKNKTQRGIKMLKGKTVVIGVTGSVAAYKAVYLARLLIKQRAEVHIILTENGAKFITPITFESLTGTKCIVDTFDRNFEFDIKHISLAKKADLFLVAPASANIIGKIANGIADDMLSTTIMAAVCPKIIAPAMNTNMYCNSIVQENIEKLKRHNYKIIAPEKGLLACKDIGDGKFPEPETILEYILYEIAKEKDMCGKKVIVTAGPTREALDPVRFISNHSTGKMGYAIVKECLMRGAKVTLISGPVPLKKPLFAEVINIMSAEEMYEEVLKRFDECDYIFKSAAVADYTPKNTFDNKIKKGEDEMSISLNRTNDILKAIGEKKTNQFICGFSMETENLIENSKKKLKSKNADMIVANNLKTDGAGFGTDTNVVTIITKDNIKELPKMSKENVACEIVNEVLK